MANNAKWYVIRTYSAYEAFVQKNVEKMIENNSLQDFIFDVSIPTAEEIKEVNGKRKVVERKKFPGYVFIKMVYTDQLGYLIRTIRGASGFVGPEGKALPLTAEEVKRMGLEKAPKSIASKPLLSFMLETLGHLPAEDESFIYENMEFTAETVVDGRVTEVIIHILDEDDIAELEEISETSGEEVEA
jgi:transcription antitermination factor NusG